MSLSSSEYTKLNKKFTDVEKEISVLSKDNKEIKKLLKTLERKINMIFDKIQDFEVEFDAAELIEDQIEKQEKYNSEWSPYSDEDYEPEDYEQYYNDDDDEDDVIRGY